MRNKFKMMLLTIATLGLFSCSDKVTDNDTPSIDEVTDGYVSFTINMIGDEMRSGMRATDDKDFAAGEKDEYAITSEYGANIAFFFDDENKFIAKSYLQVLSEPGTAEDNDTNHNNYGELSFSARIRNANGSIDKCILVLNGEPTTIGKWGEKDDGSIDSDKKLADLLKETDNAGNTLKYNEYFTMSNTVYVKEMKDDASAKVLQGPTPISSNDIYSTSEEAEQHKVRVHVERITAKVNVLLSISNATAAGSDAKMIKYGEDKPEDDGLRVRTSASYTANRDKKKWGILINGWATNAKETKSYWIKNLNDGSNFDTNTNNMSGDGKFGLWPFAYGVGSNSTAAEYNKSGWNDESRLRSYWAVDPHYNGPTDTYPMQYRESGDTNTPYGTTNASLSYISYDNITNQFSTTNQVNPEYIPENTFGEYTTFPTKNDGNDKTTYAYKGDDYMRAATHILVAAQLLIDKELEATTTPTGDDVLDKWCYENEYWVATSSSTPAENNQVPSELIKYMVKQVYAEYGKPLYTNAEGTTELKLGDSDSDNITDYFELTPATGMKGADGRVMLKYKGTAEKKLYTGEKTELKATDLDTYIKSAGTAKHYKNGKMYYAIPIKHMAPMQAESTGTSTANATPHLYNIGSYGVVRNHWYKMTIKSISKPGTPVDDPEEPIIPNDEPEDGGFVAFEIVIIPWHVIDWNVTL